MAEQKTNMTDEQLAQELRKSKGGELGGKILSLLGGVIAVAGMILAAWFSAWGKWCRASPRSRQAGRPSTPLLRTSWALPLKT